MTIKFSIDTNGLPRLGQQISNIQITLEGAGVESINKLAIGVNASSQRAILTQLRLKPAYVAAHMKVTMATPGLPIASVIATDKPTVLTRFQTRQLVTSARKAKGDRFHGIPAGYKTAGVSVTVKTGGDIKWGFLVPLRAGNVAGGNGLGVFTRIRGQNGKSAIRQRYGPSVDQAFKTVLTEILPQLGPQIDNIAATVLDATINRIFDN